MSELVPVKEVVVGERIRKDMGDIDALAASMAKNGLIEPIVLAPDGSLMAGQRRLKAAEQLGWDLISAVRLESDARAVERDENEVRKDFTPAERKAITDALLVGERHVAKEQQRAGAKKARAKGKSDASFVSGETKLRTPARRARQAAAQKAGWSEATHFRFSKIEEAHRRSPDNLRIAKIFEDVSAGLMPILPAYNAVRAIEKSEAVVIPLQRRSNTSDLHRLQKLQEKVSGIAMSLTTFDCQGGDDYRELLELLLKDLSVMRREVRRLLEGRRPDVR